MILKNFTLTFPLKTQQKKIEKLFKLLPNSIIIKINITPQKNYANRIKVMKRMILNSISRCQSNKIFSKTPSSSFFVFAVVYISQFIIFYKLSGFRVATNLFFSHLILFSHSAYFSWRKIIMNFSSSCNCLQSMIDYSSYSSSSTIIIVRWWRHRSCFHCNKIHCAGVETMRKKEKI